MKRTFVLLVTLFALSGQFGLATAQEKKVTWRLAYISAPKTVYQEVVDELPARFAKLTNGQLEIQTTPTLVPPTEHLAAIKDGRIEAALMTNAYYSGEAPLLNIGGLPGVFLSLEEYRVADEKVLHHRFAKIFEDRYNGVYLLSGVWSGQAIWSKEPIRTVADFSGKKVRAHNNMTAELMSLLGAKPIAMPLGEFIPAMQRGVVDAGITGTMTGYGLGMFQVAKYICDWRIGYPSAWGLVVNKEAWNKLPEATRKAILADMRSLEADIYKRVLVETEQGIKGSIERGAQVIRPAASEIEKTREPRLVRGVYEQWVALNKKQDIADSAEVLQAVQKVLGH